MFKRILITLCWIGGCAAMTMAQKKKEKKELQQELVPSLKLRFNPLAFAETDPNVMIGGEYRFNDRFSIGMDVAWVYWSAGEAAQGYKIRPELRYYFTPKTRMSWYAAAEASYKRVSKSTSREECAGPNCAYLQRVEYKDIKSAPGGSLKIGFQQYFSKKQRLYYELFLGIGFKVKHRFEKGYTAPSGSMQGDIIDAPFMIPDEGFLPHIPAGVKFGIRL